ncbi:MAG: SUMF1/EgtB/PvdO family nonheme iron enzyme [Armatimonadetes bacterium]|nr:SUMF1/EgtB/PvdO family nonheme iron enzyme [Armatimonadota bacterium]
MNRRTLLVSSLTALAFPLEAFARPQQGKSLAVVPRSGELAGATIYTNSYAVLIGITYQQFPSELQIKTAEADVTDLKALLVESYGFLAENVTVLLDSQASRKGIEKALSGLADRKRVQATDRVLVYFSCHGQTIKTQDGGDTGFLIPADAELDLKDTTDPVPYLRDCLPMDGLWRYLESSPARHRLLLADACFGGLIVQGKNFPKPSAATLRGFLAVPALQAIAAGGKGEEALILPGLRNSAFTHKLLEVLRQSAAADEVVPVSLLGAQLKTSVPDLILAKTNGRFKQTPQFGSRGTEGEFLFVSVGATSPTPKPQPFAGGGKAVVESANFRGGLLFSGAPAGAVIKVEGKVVSGDRFEADLVEEASKSVSVVITAPGFKAKGGRTTIKRGENLEFDARLEREAIPDPPKPEPVAPAGKVKGARKTRKGNAEMCFIPGNGTIADFWMDATPVTVAQYKAYCAATGKSMPKDKPSWGWIDDHPIVNVDWNEASAFATWAGGRLPTSAEFEYVARDGGRTIVFPWGDTFDTSKLWCSISGFGDAGKTASVTRQDRIYVNSHGQDGFSNAPGSYLCEQPWPV